MGYPLYREVKKWAPATLTHREKLAAMVLADDANDVTRETFNSVVDPDILAFAMVRNDRDMRKILARLVEEKVLERVTIGGNGRTAKYRFLYLAPVGSPNVAGPEETASGTTSSEVGGPIQTPNSEVAGLDQTPNSPVAGPDRTSNPEVQPGPDVPERTSNSRVAGSFRNSCRSDSDLPTPLTSSTTSSTTSAATAAETTSPDGALFDEPAPAPAAAAKTPKRRSASSRPAEPVNPDAFADFWNAYPRRTEKRDAVRAWNRAIGDGVPPERILQAARAYAVERRGEPPKFTKHPARWLNAGCYDDESPGPAAALSGPPTAPRHMTEEEKRDALQF
ncbi:hypothetical protein QBA57_21465 [Streptomyces scabiei]|uniref:hypothetical protein n=1 Tax=Streptomyces scabiei TaxID=1930 RepID=UPI001B310881|nr:MULTISPECIES: hypothetical protein [unclassified Streptomyces]MBP5884512.1 hypothetical protein [Streptomyces sp. LBUM 1487]QTU47630.1 hypothetical protein F3K20_24925 [Streptomyces sp. LBUM 1482]